MQPSLHPSAFPRAPAHTRDVDVDVDVDVEVEAVIPYPTNAPDWYANIQSVGWRTQPPVAVGSQLDFEARFLGRRLSYTYEVVDLEPGWRLVMRT